MPTGPRLPRFEVRYGIAYTLRKGWRRAGESARLSLSLLSTQRKGGKDMQRAWLRIPWRDWRLIRIWQLLSLTAVCGLYGLAYAEQVSTGDRTTEPDKPVKQYWVPKGEEFSLAVLNGHQPDRLSQKKPIGRHRHTPGATWLPKGSEFPATFERKPTYHQQREATAHQTPHKRRANAHARQAPTIRRTTEWQPRSLPQKHRQQFLRYPLRFTRISSKFSHARFHPILKRTRPHLGVDFAAPRGTPVRAIADGTVQYAGWRGGLGRFVRLDHPGPYGSGYGHLQRIAKGVREGRRVRRGQIIGYVGSTGLATGPHLHYVLYKHGQHVDPLRRQLPTTDESIHLTQPAPPPQFIQIHSP